MLVAGLATETAAQTRPAAGRTPDWTGAHLGLSGGALRSEGSAVRDAFMGGLISLDVENGLFPARRRGTDYGVAGGIGLGIDRQWGALVAGVALDAALTDLRAEHRFSRIDPNPDPLFNGVITNTRYLTRLDALFTLRVRGGVADGPTLYYATAGLAAGRVTNRFTLDLPNLGPGYFNDWESSGVRFGWVVGAGVERRLDDRLSVAAEILHYDLRDVTIRGRDTVFFPGQGLDYRFHNDGQIVRVGLNIRF